MVRSVALKGCVIIKQDDHKIVFRGKCEKCGSVAGSDHEIGQLSDHNTRSDTYYCTKCNNHQEVKLEGFSQ